MHLLNMWRRPAFDHSNDDRPPSCDCVHVKCDNRGARIAIPWLSRTPQVACVVPHSSAELCLQQPTTNTAVRDIAMSRCVVTQLTIREKRTLGGTPLGAADRLSRDSTRPSRIARTDTGSNNDGSRTSSVCDLVAVVLPVVARRTCARGIASTCAATTAARVARWPGLDVRAARA